MSHKVLIVDDLHPSFMEGLEEIGMSYDYLPDLNRNETEGIIDKYSVLVIRSKFFVDDRFMSLATNLRIIARAGSGMDNIDDRAAAERGIKCINAPEGNRNAVAEHALGLMLNLIRNIHKSREEVQHYSWLREENRGRELSETTVGIIGYGNTGESLAQKLNALGCNVLFFDKFKKNIPTSFARESLMEEIGELADVVSFHIPLTKENAGIINKTMIESFKKKVILLNVSRGRIMRTDDIIWGLKTGKLSGVGLDVLENEKLETLSAEERAQLNFLSKHPNVILTPHIAGWTSESYRKISEVLLAKLRPLLI